MLIHIIAAAALVGLATCSTTTAGAGDRPSKQVRLTLGDPIVVAQAPEGETRWGQWQFPNITRLADGRIRVGWHAGVDSATAYGAGTGHAAVSSDDGKTWTLLEKPEADKAVRATRLSNGDYLTLTSETSVPLKDIDLPKPVGEVTSTYGKLLFKFYLPEQLPENLRKGYPQLRLTKGSTTWAREYPKVEIPGVTQVAREGVLVRPFFMGNLLTAPDGSLWTSFYWNRFIDGKLTPYMPTFVRSTDHGHTWRFISDIPYQPDKSADPKWDKRDGFTEPELAFLPDGSMLAIFRTTDGAGTGPSYTARSTDQGKTWSKPQVFDDLGVLPQLLVLRNGVTIASYGRPGLYVRATNDKSARTWADRVQVPLHGNTCAYTQLLALNDNTALLVYSDFGHPDTQGKPRKTIMIRTITVTPPGR